MGPVPGSGEERGENGPGRLSRGGGVVQNKESRKRGELAGLSLEEVLTSAHSPLKVEGFRPAVKGLVREQSLTFVITVVVHGSSPPCVYGHV